MEASATSKTQGDVAGLGILLALSLGILLAVLERIEW